MTATSIVGQLPIIPALPPSLQRVPSWLDHPEAPRDDEWRTQWPVWSENLKDFRVWATRKASKDPHFRHAQMVACANDTAYFMAVYGWFFEPRDTPLGPPGWYQWALMPHQVLAVRQLEEAMRSPKPRSDVVWEKSRDLVATWTAMGVVAKHWLFDKAFTAGLVSYKEDAVDDGTPDSMFFKLRGLLGYLEYGESPGIPYWMKPDGYIPQVHGRRLKLNHPSRMCVVRGEATTMRTGTGFRNTLRVNDEAAKHELFQETLDSIRAASNCILSMSSAYTHYGQDFRHYAKSARAAEAALDAGTPEAVPGPRYYRMEHWMHPFHDEPWLDRERSSYQSKEAFAREVLIDYQAGDSSLLYFDEAEKMPRVDEGDTPEYDLLMGIDPGKADRTAIVFANAYGDPFRPRVRWIDSYETTNKPPIFYAWLLSGIAPIPGETGYVLYADYLGDNEHRLMEWMLKNWLNGRPVRAVMDPAGAQVALAAMSGDIKAKDNNFPSQLNRAVLALRQRYAAEHGDCPAPSFLNLKWEHLYRTNKFEPRRDNLRSVMDNSEIADPLRYPGAARLLECWQSAHTKESPRETISEPSVVKDDDYHLTAASEYLACDVKERGFPSAFATTTRTAPRPRSAPKERKKAA